MIRLVLADNKTAKFTGKTFSYKDLIRAIPGAKWNKPQKWWEIPVDSIGDALRIMPSLDVDTEAQKAFKQLHKRNKEAVKVKESEVTEAQCKVKGLKGTLRKYQGVGKAFLDTLEDGEGGILAFDMGLGKSLTALANCLDWKNKGIIDHILVICPSPLKYATWAKEVEKWTDLEYMVIDGDKTEEVEWDDGTKEKLTGRKLREVQYQQYEYGADVLIMNYELFLHDSESNEKITWEKVHTFKKKDKEEFAKFADEWCQDNVMQDDSEGYWEGVSKAYLAHKGYDTENYELRAPKNPYIVRKSSQYNIIPEITGRWAVIMDEAHRIKNPKATTTKELVKRVRPAGRKILGTGTPLENNLEELWTLVDLCRPGLLGNFFKFQERYMEKDFFGRTVAPKAGMMHELKERIDPIMIRKTKQEALPDLPPLVTMNYKVKMTDTQKKLYKAVSDGIIEGAKTGEVTYMEVLAQLTRLQQLCDSPALLREVFEDDELPIESGKLTELRNIIEDVAPKHKFILFSQYSQMTDILYRWLIDNKLLTADQIGYVKGGIKATETERIRKGFQDGDIQCVLMTTAGNYGLDLYAGSYVICYDSLFNPQKMEQIYSRAHRGGNITGVTAINLITEGSYEEKKQEILDRKRELFAAFVDNDDAMYQKLFSTTSDLLELV